MADRYDETGQKFGTDTNGAEFNYTGFPGQVRHGYMCAVDFQDEVGNTTTGPICDTLEALKERKPCINECGWVRVILVAVEFGR